MSYNIFSSTLRKSKFFILEKESREQKLYKYDIYRDNYVGGKNKIFKQKYLDWQKSI